MEVVIDGATYRTGRLDARQQLHVGRRLIPALPGLLGSIVNADFSKLDGGSTLLLAAGPVGQAIAIMPQEDADYVVNTCLAVCSKRVGDAWAPMMASNGQLMDSELPLKVMLRMVVETIKDNIGNFSPGKGTTS
jgi:hypothetical protein